jgi:hypothetical protein
MPIAVPSNNISVATYTRAVDIPERITTLLASDQRNTNIIYPFIVKTRDSEEQGHVVQGNLWLVFSSYPNSRSDPVVDFIVAVTTGPLGDYPAFIYHARPLAALTPSFLDSRVKAIADTLAQRISHRRLFSVFAVEPVTRAFVAAWTARTGIQIADAHVKKAAEYYAALLSFCDRRSFRYRSMTMHPYLAYDIRRAVEEDIPIVARLCYEFAQGSVSRLSLPYPICPLNAKQEPFVMTMEAAEAEATMYIKKGQMWVHGIQNQDGSGKAGIASICAVSRVSDAVAGITKVYTNPEYRKMGCAERLVRQVCRQCVISSPAIRIRT